MKKIKELWFWIWGNGKEVHPSMFPYTGRLVIYFFIFLTIYAVIKELYNYFLYK